ncbi:hypothetical protein LNI89_11740 [Tenacibaculum dicentrarchi]|nr:hypothetical protein [Tenacibaculum dicentrarchi]
MKKYTVRIVKFTIVSIIVLIYIYIYEKYYYDRGEIIKDSYKEKEIVVGFTKIFYISKEEVLKCSVYGKAGEWDIDYEVMFYEMRGDSIVTDYREMRFNLPKKETAIALQKKRCKKVSYTKFFPKYMLKVDKIDYKKLQTGNYTKRELKYPHKTKNIKGW